MDWKLSELRRRGQCSPHRDTSCGAGGHCGVGLRGPEPQLGSLDWNQNAKGSFGASQAQAAASVTRLLMRQNAARAQRYL